MNLTDINKKFDEEFQINNNDVVLYRDSERYQNRIHMRDGLKNFINSQIRALLEGLKMENREHHSYCYTNFNEYCDCCIDDCNKIIGEINQKIDNIINN